MELLVNIDVDDLRRGVAFYTQAFGLREARHFGDEVVELVGASSRIYLLRKPAGTLAASASTRHYQRHWTPVHLDIVVDGDLPAAVARAVAAGAVVEAPIATHSWGRIATVADPFGHGLCLLQFSSAGYDAITTRS